MKSDSNNPIGGIVAMEILRFIRAGVIAPMVILFAGMIGIIIVGIYDIFGYFPKFILQILGNWDTIGNSEVLKIYGMITLIIFILESALKYFLKLKSNLSFKVKLKIAITVVILGYITIFIMIPFLNLKQDSDLLGMYIVSIVFLYLQLARVFFVRGRLIL